MRTVDPRWGDAFVFGRSQRVRLGAMQLEVVLKDHDRVGEAHIFMGLIDDNHISTLSSNKSSPPNHR